MKLRLNSEGICILTPSGTLQVEVYNHDNRLRFIPEIPEDGRRDTLVEWYALIDTKSKEILEILAVRKGDTPVSGNPKAVIFVKIDGTKLNRQ